MYFLKTTHRPLPLLRSARASLHANFENAKGEKKAESSFVCEFCGSDVVMRDNPMRSERRMASNAMR
jgi:hypothetical protein